MSSLIISFVIGMTFVGAIASLFLKRASSKGSFVNMLLDYNIYSRKMKTNRFLERRVIYGI